MKKSPLFSMALIGLSVVFGAAQADQTKGQNAPSTMPAADCSSLTMEEQQFAAQLSSMQKGAFCNKFNSAMRTMAMQLVGQPDINGNMMGADQAVERVARDNNIMMQPMPNSRSGGGCPVK